jgi:protein-disulfide isomerase
LGGAFNVIRILFSFILAASFSVVAQQTSTNEIDRRIERQVRAYAEAPPEAKITFGARGPSNFAGYDKLPVDIEANGDKKTFNFLVAKDGSKLLYVREFDLSEDPYAKAMSKIDLHDRPVRGAQDAKVTIVIYDDYQCPFCARSYVTIMNEVMTKYRDRARVIIKDFPLTETHPWALRAAVDSTCMAQNSQNAYWQFSDYVHTHQQEFNSKWKPGEPDKTFSALDDLALKTAERTGAEANKLQACLAAQNPATVKASIAEGKSLGVSATPTLFVNGEEFEGVLTPEQIDAALDRALREAQ